MFLTVTSTAAQASDLGFLLHKHPDRVQSFELPVGLAHVFYPEATAERCTVALLVEVDPIGLVRDKRFGGDRFALSHYVNDRPYAASSMLSVAVGRVFRTAMKGQCAARPDLEGALLPLTIHVPAVPCREGPQLVERLFGPLGWQVRGEVADLDPQVARWGAAPYVDVTLTGTMTLADALKHLYVLLPVLDDAKHYWVSADEVDKLIRSGGSWLQGHPERDAITRRYLAHQRRYVAEATQRLAELEDLDPAGGEDDDSAGAGRVRPLNERRKAAVVTALKDTGAHRVVDLGCGEGALLRELVTDATFTEIMGVDVAARLLDRAARALERLSDSQRARLTLRQSSATYRDREIEGFDAIVLMEVVEHVDPDRLPALERSVFAYARPATVVVTTPNAECNALFESLPAGTMRHPDHRFEWTRHEFAAWAEGVGGRFGYSVEYRGVGDVDARLGSPTQLAVFRRVETAVHAS